MWDLFRRRRPAEVEVSFSFSAPVRASDPVLPDGVDLRHLESTRIRVKGTMALIPDSERETLGGRVYVLRREPKNKHDPNAIAVLSEGRKVGYVSASRAAMMAPLLDRIGSDVLVNGMGAMTNSIRLWVDLPKAAALRGFVKAL